MTHHDQYDHLARQYVEAIEAGNAGARVRLEAELDQLTDDAHRRLTAPDALIKAALWYGKQGIPVFPCRPRGKEPATPNGFKDASTDDVKIREWWTRNPAYNIGTPTGIKFDVIDVDGREGVMSVYFGDDPMQLPSPEIGHVKTSRQAGHHIYIAPTGAGNKASMLPGVDYRGRGGYVIAPPSIGPNGKRYTWTQPLELTT